MSSRPPLGEQANKHNMLGERPPGKTSVLGKRPFAFDSMDKREAQHLGFEPLPGPAVIRRKMRTFVENTGMKLGEFQGLLGVSAHSYRNFMAQSGNKGEGSDAYAAGARFFVDREARGDKMPRKKQRQDKFDNLNSTNKKKGVASGDDVASIRLNGQETESVPIFDTCDEVRRKIDAYMKTSVTQAAFCRTLAAQFPGKDVKVQPSSLQSFRSQRGPRSGGNNKVFYAAYVFLEKLRIHSGQAKTKHRETMEGIYPGGFPREGNGHVWALAGETITEDKFGRIAINGRILS